MTQTKFKTYYFPTFLRWILSLFSFGLASYLMIWYHQDWPVLALIALTIFVWTAYYELKVDLNESKITDSFKAFGIPFKNTTTEFKVLKGIVLEKERHTYTANSRFKTSQTDYFDYVGLLQYDAEGQLEIYRSIEYGSFLQKMNQLAEELKIGLKKKF